MRVWLPDKKVEGTVVDKAGLPRSYTVETPKGQLRGKQTPSESSPRNA